MIRPKVSTNGKKRKPTFVRLMEKLTKLNYGTLFGIWASMALVFGVLYFVLSFIGDGQHGPSQIHDMKPALRFYNALYYSIITATSTGYGDITPHGISKIVASMQSISALCVFALFVTKLVSHQQEMTLTEVHRLTFEDVFHNTREGMFIARKDFDHAIHHIKHHRSMDMENWENVTIAYRQLQSLFEEIPDFYQNDTHRYTIDRRREELLLEAAHRTLHRINQMLDFMSEHEIDWLSHEQSMRELTELVRIVSETTPVWKEKSPYGDYEAFEDIFQMKERMHLKMMETIKP